MAERHDLQLPLLTLVKVSFSALTYERDFAILFLQHMDTESNIYLGIYGACYHGFNKGCKGEGCCW